MTPETEQAGELLRVRGMRSTPQRRAILAAFQGGAAEHLSADEVFARASQSLPELSRGTVYATLAEFAEAGLLASFGTPDPVRYETNTTPHAHFRCRLCLRIFDIEMDLPDPPPIRQAGFQVERTDFRAEGTCAECGKYARGLRAGTRAIARSGGSTAQIADPATEITEVDTPLGPLLLVATPAGVVRVAFPEHADAPELHARVRSSDHGAEPAECAGARHHLAAAVRQLNRYFAGDPAPDECEIDWTAIDGATALQAIREIPFGTRLSYAELPVATPPSELGRIFGANPVPLLIPCQRITRGIEIPGNYVGGPRRRAWLIEHERTHAHTSE